MSSSTRRRAVRAAWAVLTAASLVGVAAASTATALAGPATTTVQSSPVRAALVSDEYAQRFLAQYDKIKDPDNGYFSPQGIPYHSVETLIVEAPDHGHMTTSEAYSYWIWLEALYGQVTGDWAPINEAWATMEEYMIPQQADQPTNSFYNASKPATYAPEFNHPSSYPSQLNTGVTVGQDPIAGELAATYGNRDIYQMHWLADVDNVYGYGNAPGPGCQLGPSHDGVSLINTFQRGAQESVWETVPQPTCDDFTFGGRNGYLDLFTGDASYAKQWKYTSASDADARAVEAVYWANQWATAQGKQAQVASIVEKAAKMGDYLRYTLFDKYFKQIGCTSPSCPAGSGRSSAHYLLSWYMAWGGATDTNAGWAWRIGSSHAHFGYQNPLAAWALSTDPALTPDSPTAKSDWAASKTRQLEFYRWLQSADGPIAGGATNSWDGAYATPPAGTPTFYGMGYTEAPVYHDPPSNQWFGMQAWGVQRVAELYYASGDPQAKAILDKWVPWVVDHISTDGASWKVPSELTWSGKPDTWNAANPGANANLRVTVKSYGQDVGVAGDVSRALLFYAARSGDTESRDAAKGLLDAIWAHNQDPLGVSAVETRGDYLRFDDTYTAGGNGIYIPSTWRGTMPNGDVIQPGVSFLDIRSFYEDDPQWSKVETALATGVAPQFSYHRFWSQTAIAAALADYSRLFENGGPTPTPTPTPTVTPTPTPTPTVTPTPTPTPTVTPTPTPSVTPTPTPTPTPGAACRVTYTASSWNTGFTGSIRLTNTGTSALNGWSLRFTFPGSQQVTQGWSAQWSQSGATVTATNAAWNGTLAPGATVDIGFNGSHPGQNPAPTAFTVNGSTCTVG
ncbi:glycoside hydrolase family 48 protein [Cellulomonas sp. SLBN-39]|uniref:glycoside hydrolase family 48 protein n=1 Tax=Cellulomonas sp. SLBN-39 TaxID=2768446 RepID=UPI001151496B|nr:glycoside hydrolase family 48 protein [Cellulomonas sp. SLBN-39]TQL02827.1 cellulose binding domain-containing protein [Cellulomonas sp. SLBN-39]